MAAVAQLVDGVGLWRERLAPPPPPGRAALFLDRDGVIVAETHYLHRPDDVRLIAGAAAAIAACNARGVPVVVVTNQAGIARGLYGWADFAAVQAEMIRRLAAAGAHLDLVLACAYHDKGRDPFRVPDHPWRKPNPGMLHAAAAEFALALAGSVLVGDKLSDLDAGLAAGLAEVVLVATGHGREEEPALPRLAAHGARVAVADDLAAALAGRLDRLAAPA